MSGASDQAGTNAANEWRNRSANDPLQASRRNETGAHTQYRSSGYDGAPKLGDGWTKAKPSGLGVQIDAMIERLKADGHSPANIARVMRLRADKMDEQT